MKDRTLISVVVPVYNEETNIQPFYKELTRVIDPLNTAFELIFVDDGSNDSTLSLIENLSRSDPRVKSIRFSRNFGSHAALLAGLRWATGDAAVIVSVDLQDPPELIPEMIKKWQKGFHIVWAVREGRDDPFFKKLFAVAFYQLFSRIALKNYPKTGMDFGLIDKCVLEHLKTFRENNFDIILVIMSFGFQQTLIPYYRQARHSGYSKWSLGKRIKAAVDLIVSYSYFPIRFISYMGMFISLASFIYAFFLIIGKWFFGIGGMGWSSLMVTILFLGGVQLITLGILGEYLWRCNDQVKGKPQYIITDTIGFNHTSNTVNMGDGGKADNRNH